ncbi:MAG: S1 RNA-binding domain-containing protein, partial [bacterium]
RPAGRLTDWIGREIPVRVAKLDGRKGAIEVAHADAGRGEAAAAPAETPAEPLPARTLAEIQPDEVIEGRVVRLTKFGAFVDLGGVDGLIALAELDRGRVTRAGEVLSVGESVTVKVLSVDAEKGRVALSRKALQADPWDEVAQRFAPGTRTSGTVVGLAEYGAFVAVAPGLEGLVHLSELTWGAAPKDARSVVKVGQAVDVEVLELDAERRRLKLSVKRTAANPWETLHDTYPPGPPARPGAHVTDFGVFVGVADRVDGLVHVSDMEWGQTVRDPDPGSRRARPSR